MVRMQTATDLAPLSEKYAIAAANQAVLLGDLDNGHGDYSRAPLQPIPAAPTHSPA